VTDDDGATHSFVQPVTVAGTPDNRAPTASFTFNCIELTCSFDGNGSSDPDGTIAGWNWNFGDGASGSGASSSHTYSSGGPYTVILTVTDNRAATGQQVRQVTVSAPPPPNQPPTAAFTFSCTDLDCSFDGTSSTDADGRIVDWSWS
jgi:PKD repeat protein